MKIKEYITIRGCSCKILDEAINEKIKEGYQPYGSPFGLLGDGGYQAMVKYEEESNSNDFLTEEGVLEGSILDAVKRLKEIIKNNSHFTYTETETRPFKERKVIDVFEESFDNIEELLSAESCDKYYGWETISKKNLTLKMVKYDS